jgi:SAM-dependent methyltransferase
MRFRDLIPLSIRKVLGDNFTALNRRVSKSYLLWSLRGNAVKCNVCGWEGRHFADDQWHPRTVCPSCRCQVRHRLLVATLDGESTHQELREEELLRGKAVLHFAPERQFRDRVRQVAAKHVTADFDRGDCDLKLDISAMPQVEDASFDTVIVCDVLEHVPDDAGAFREIRRVLKPGGTAIMSVPQKDSPATTDEDFSVTAPEERLKRFGQHDHVRMYGDEFVERVRASGLEVAMITKADFKPETVSRLVLDPPVPSPHPLATNQRRIYFCRRM